VAISVGLTSTSIPLPIIDQQLIADDRAWSIIRRRFAFLFADLIDQLSFDDHHIEKIGEWAVDLLMTAQMHDGQELMHDIRVFIRILLSRNNNRQLIAIIDRKQLWPILMITFP